MEQLSLFGKDEFESVKPKKSGKIRKIISASRRTDIPAFYWAWMKKCIELGYAETVNPYNLQISKVDITTENIIVFWSKNYANFVKNNDFLKDFDLYFQFTINNYSKVLEPNVLPKSETIKQVDFIANKYSPEHLNIRFDPIILTTDCTGELFNTMPKYGAARLMAFEDLCKDLNATGVHRVTTSFVSLYGHVKERLNRVGIPFKELNEQDQISFIERMVEIADKYNIQIYTCSSPLIQNVKGVKMGHCIDQEVLESLFNCKVTSSKDAGQRPACGCVTSRDIGGTYDVKKTSGMSEEHIQKLRELDKKCHHNCIYCYGNLNKR